VRAHLEKKKKVVFIGMAHRANDSRLCHFLARAIRERFQTVECFYLGKDSIDPAKNASPYFKILPMPGGLYAPKRVFRLSDLEAMAAYLAELRVDLVQVSDARELLAGYVIKTRARIPVVFDAHEDYFNQKYEYGGKTALSFIRGARHRLHELLFVRWMDAVFCTDDYLLNLYTHPSFAAKRVQMVRNVPPPSMLRSAPVIHNRRDLKLVYVGSINKRRGVIETAKWVVRFNQEDHGFKLAFHVFSGNAEFVEPLEKPGEVVYRGHLPYEEVSDHLTDFDVGVCLIQPTTKYERNIPIKNFEYMCSGLPVLTSDYGQMKKYVGTAGAGVTIDPLSYAAFVSAVVRLRDAEFRKTCGDGGIAYARQHLVRSQEVTPYLQTVGELLDLDESVGGIRRWDTA
jgi:glycosyltransferase involved in cell wall biosynthesis